jgi:hypothetical protein
MLVRGSNYHAKTETYTARLTIYRTAGDDEEKEFMAEASGMFYDGSLDDLDIEVEGGFKLTTDERDRLIEKIYLARDHGEK